MKESAWRYKLVQKFKEHNPHGFIWAHDAHFKTGFPDLTTIVQGTTKWIELKRIRNIGCDPLKQLKPTQRETLNKMVVASKGRCFVLARADDSGNVCCVNLLTMANIKWPGEFFHRENWWDLVG